MEAIRKHRLAGPINVCHGHSASLLEIVKTVEEATGKTVSLAYEEAPAWDVRDSCLDNSLLRSLTGWEPKVGLQEGVRKLLDHYTRQQ
jgi:nucleoside-diphosphate-sugar epimerase